MIAARPSRHDHFPRGDAARRRALRRAAGDLDALWTAADTGPDGLLTAIDAVADVPVDDAIDRLLPWLHDAAWLRARIDAALALLRADPFARPPLRLVGGGDDAPGGLVLADRGAVRLTLQLRPFAPAAPPPTGALFVPGRAALHVLRSGGASLCRHHVAVSAAQQSGAFTAKSAARCHTLPPRPLRDGETLILDTARHSVTLAGATGDVLLLELSIQPPSRLPVRVYDIASGTLRHVSASRRDSSFRHMALALLRHLGRTDAAPLFVAEAQSDDFAARWHAMRELVALDPAAARAPLAAMAAADPHPEVRRAAKATLALLSPLPLAGGGVTRHVTRDTGGPVTSNAAQHAPPKPSPTGEGLTPCLGP